MDKITASTGNVFEDLGFDAGEAAHMKLRAELMIALEREVSKMKGPQAQIAASLGLHQSRISDIKHMKVDAFSADKLVDLLGRVGKRVEIKVKAA